MNPLMSGRHVKISFYMKDMGMVKLIVPMLIFSKKASRFI